MPVYITDDIEISSDSDREDSDEKISNEENSDEVNRMCLVFVFEAFQVILGYS